MEFTVRSFLLRLARAVGVVLLFAMPARAGGPKYVAGTSYFETNMAGQPLTWPLGQITYYTDQGDLSPILPNSAANALVADAFSQWTLVPTAALSATSGGQLAEDVNGTNVIRNSNGTISVPADIQPSATSTPVGMVYDYDGSVTDALLGSGAGDASQCFYNAAYGGNDNYNALASYQHALIVINGQCALESSQVIEVEYRLVRVMGTVFGLGWSQLNSNVVTGNPPPSSADYAGFPVMHDSDPVSCVPITNCYPHPYQLAPDDVAAISRLYPVTVQNQSTFSGRQVLPSTTARIHGSVWFTDASGNPTQPMQGVNVVARWVDASTGLSSRQYAASSVSGYLFTGNAGNPVTGFYDDLGNPFSQWGSSNTTLEGSFDLAGLPLPNGGSAQYQLTVEALDPDWSTRVGPYAPYLVTPSGAAAPITVTVSAGHDIAQDILMSASAQPLPPWSPSHTWTAPAPIPASGDWSASLADYGDTVFMLLPAQSNRTLSVAVRALDEAGHTSESKAQPVVGIWAASDPEGTASPAFTLSPFNTSIFGLTRLDAQIGTPTNFLIGIADLRGDGRPDYHYQAHVLYADSVSPSRISAAGGAVTVEGTGFAPGFTANIGSALATPLAVSAGRMILAAPAATDGPQTITITDPSTESSTAMSDALTVGAAATDTIVLLSALNPSTPVGAQAPHPVAVRVLAADGVTPVAGATIGWTANNKLQLSLCNATSSCTALTDQSGNSINWLTPTTAGTSTITATLAPGVYSPSKSVSATLNATESSSDIGALTPYMWVAQGATVTTPLAVRVLSNGTPQKNVAVNYTVSTGSGTLGSPSTQTDANGNASVTLLLTQLAGPVQVSACVAPTNAPCQNFYVSPVPLSQLQLQPVAGAGQVSAGQAFQPVLVRVTDSASPPHPVLGAVVMFQITVLRPGGMSSSGGGETNPGNPAMPVILNVSRPSFASDVSGLARVTPTSAGFSGQLEVDVAVTAGTSAALDDPLELLPGPASGSAVMAKPQPIGRPVRSISGRAH